MSADVCVSSEMCIMTKSAKWMLFQINLLTRNQNNLLMTTWPRSLEFLFSTAWLDWETTINITWLNTTTDNRLCTKTKPCQKTKYSLYLHPLLLLTCSFSRTKRMNCQLFLFFKKFQDYFCENNNKILIISLEWLMRPSAKLQVLHRWVSWRHAGSGQRDVGVCFLPVVKQVSNIYGHYSKRSKRKVTQQRNVHVRWVNLLSAVTVSRLARDEQRVMLTARVCPPFVSFPPVTDRRPAGEMITVSFWKPRICDMFYCVKKHQLIWFNDQRKWVVNTSTAWREIKNLKGF